MTPVVLALGVSHRDVDLAALWLRWVGFLAQRAPGSTQFGPLLVMLTRRAATHLAFLTGLCAVTPRFRVRVVECQDEDESGYPKSASHLFLRTLEKAESEYPGHAVFWCEPDTVPMKPTWFAEIAAEYQACGKPFLGMRVGTQFPHLSGNSIYPPNWRELAPSIANVLNAPDYKLWGPGKGQPWDVFCRKETTPQMAESKLMFQEWKERDARGTRLSDIPEGTCLFHQDKAGALIREIARTRYPEFMASIFEPRKFYFMNGHPSRLRVKGVRVRFSFTKWTLGGHRSAVCSDELDDEEAATISALVGQLGVREIPQEEFLTMTGRSVSSLPEPRPRAARPVKHESPAVAATHPSVFVMLGRYGDICNILPMLKAEDEAGRRPTLVVSKDFADILDGVSYVDRIVWNGAYDQLSDALRWLRKERSIVAPVVCQYHKHPTDKARLTDSYQKEVWRMAGRLADFESRGPLEFDQRDPNREGELWRRFSIGKKPLLLVGLESSSSPIKNKVLITLAIAEHFNRTHRVVNLKNVKAEKIYDLIGLLDHAALLITADTVFLHLARTSKVTTIALVNDGWRGSVSDHAYATIRYADASPQWVVDVTEKTLSRKMDRLFEGRKEGGKTGRRPQPPRIFHAVDVFGAEARHHAAQGSWNDAYKEGIIPAHFTQGKRDAASVLGDPRKLPFLKDILWAAIPENASECGNDIVVWTNSDIGLVTGLADALRKHIGNHHAATMRRVETNGRRHPGRDLFAFTVDWLHEHWDEIPDYVIGAPVFDLGICALVRRFHGLPFSLKSSAVDMPPADMPPGHARHEPHAPEWRMPNMDSLPSVRHNKRLVREWAAKYAPEILFSPGGNLK